MNDDRTPDLPEQINKLYRKKPVVIEAAQLTEEMAAAYLLERKPLPAGVEFGSASHKDGKIHNFYSYVETPEGRMNVSIGDWIITGVKGEHYPCKPDIFAATYEPAALSAAPAQEPVGPDEDAQWAIDRAADFLEQYAAFIHRVKPEEIEEHPYLPELESVAEQVRALRTWPLYASPLPQEPQEGKALTDERIVEIRDNLLPSQGEQFDCLAFARAIERELRGAQEGKALTPERIEAVRQWFIEKHACWFTAASLREMFALASREGEQR